MNSRHSFDHPAPTSIAILRQSALDGPLSEIFAYSLVIGLIGLVVFLGFVL